MTRKSLVFCLLLLGACSGERSDPTPGLAGTWGAERDFGPDVSGLLTITHQQDRWEAEIAGFAATATGENGAIAFELPEERGSFRGRLAAEGTRIVGHWI